MASSSVPGVFQPVNHAEDTRLGPYFFTFSQSAGLPPITVPGMLVPLMWPPPPNLTDWPRSGPSFVLTNFPDAVHAVAVPNSPPGQSVPSPDLHQQQPTSSSLQVPSSASNFATWSAGQGATSVNVTFSLAQDGAQISVVAGNSDSGLAVPAQLAEAGKKQVRAPSPVGTSASKAEPATRSSDRERPSHTSRGTQTYHSRTPPRTPDDTVLHVKSPPSTRGKERPSLPTSWMPMPPGESSSVKTDNVALKVGGTERIVYRRPTTAASNCERVPSLRRTGTFYRSRDPTPMNGVSPENSFASKSSTWSFPRKSPISERASRRVLRILTGSTSPMSSTPKQDIFRDDANRRKVDCDLRKSVRGPSCAHACDIRRPASPSPRRMATELHRNDDLTESEGSSSESDFSPRRVQHKQQASDGSIPSLQDLETIPSIDFTPPSRRHPLPQRSPSQHEQHNVTLGNTSIANVSRRLQNLFARQELVSMPFSPLTRQASQRADSVPGLVEKDKGVFMYDLDIGSGSRFSPRERQTSAGGGVTKGSEAGGTKPAFSPSQSSIGDQPHIFDVDRAFARDNIYSIPTGCINVDDASFVTSVFDPVAPHRYTASSLASESRSRLVDSQSSHNACGNSAPIEEERHEAEDGAASDSDSVAAQDHSHDSDRAEDQMPTVAAGDRSEEPPQLQEPEVPTSSQWSSWVSEWAAKPARPYRPSLRESLPTSSHQLSTIEEASESSPNGQGSPRKLIKLWPDESPRVLSKSV